MKQLLTKTESCALLLLGNLEFIFNGMSEIKAIEICWWPEYIDFVFYFTEGLLFECPALNLT